MSSDVGLWTGIGSLAIGAIGMGLKVHASLAEKMSRGDDSVKEWAREIFANKSDLKVVETEIRGMKQLLEDKMDVILTELRKP